MWPAEHHSDMRRPLSGSPTLVLLVVLAAVFAIQHVVGFVAESRSLFALSPAVASEPWTLVTSVLAHGSLSHLAANAFALAVVGFLLERDTSPLRFYAFFLIAGALAGLTEVWLAALLGPLVPGITARVSVLGASGAVFALLGYLLASNRLTETVVGGLEVSPRVQIVVFAVAAAAVTLVTARPQVAVIAHFTGLLLGLLAGRTHLLRPGDAESRAAAA